MAAGMAALNEWPEMFSIDVHKWGQRSPFKALLKSWFDKNFDEEKEKTGHFCFSAEGFESCKLFRQLNGHALLSLDLKMSTN